MEDVDRILVILKSRPPHHTAQMGFLPAHVGQVVLLDAVGTAGRALADPAVVR